MITLCSGKQKKQNKKNNSEINLKVYSLKQKLDQAHKKQSHQKIKTSKTYFLPHVFLTYFSPNKQTNLDLH